MAKQRYENLDGISNKKSFKDMRQWRKERKSKMKDLSYTVPQAENKKIELLNENRTQNTVTWIGHATFLIQMGGMNIMTDPVWAKRMGFEKRLSEPGLTMEEIPPIDVVLISHGHYDHLDFATLNRLKGNPVHLVPEGLGRLLTKKGFSKVEEFSWWDKKDSRTGTLEIHFVPAQHWTRRTLTDMNTSLWGGWVIINKENGETVYFVGDTGYFRGFKEIAKHFDINWVLMPIGAYEPEWFMSASHISPEDAVQAFLDCKADKFIPMHYGAFRLADDTPKEALDRLLKEWEKRKLDQDLLYIPKLGETVIT